MKSDGRPRIPAEECQLANPKNRCVSILVNISQLCECQHLKPILANIDMAELWRCSHPREGKPSEISDS